MSDLDGLKPVSRIASSSYLTVDDLAAELKLKPGYIYRLVAAGKLEHVKINRLIRFRRESVEQFIEKQTKGAV